MTSPSPAQRIALASSAMGGDKPSTAMALAGSDLSDSEIAAVSGFINGMGTSMVARMARQSGVPVKFSAEEKSQLDALGEDYKGIDPTDEEEPRSFWEKAWNIAGDALGNVGEFLIDNPVSQKVFDGFDALFDGVKLPARMLGDALDPNNNDEIDSAMQAQGYDPDSRASYVAFMYKQGDSLFHDLDGLREQYTDEMVDVALDFFADPEAFNQRRLDDPAFDQKVGAIMAKPDWAKAADAVDRKHISPGRDVARLLLGDDAEQGAWFTAISGALDTVYTIALDPTLVLGKGIRLARAADAITGARNVTGISRFGLANNLVAPGIDKAAGLLGRPGYFRGGIDKTRAEESLRALFAVDEETGRAKTQVGRHIQKFLNDAAKLRATEDADEAGKLFARMQRLYEPLMPLLDEVNGYARAKAPIADGSQVSSEWTIISDANGLAWDADRPSLAQAQHEARMNEMRDNIKDLRRQVNEDEAFREKWRGKKAPADVPRPPGGWQGELQRKQALADLEAELDGFVVPQRFRNGVKEINTLDEFADFMVSTNGLLRLGHGVGAATRPIMPGRIAARKRITAALRDRMPVFDHTKLGRDSLPHESEEALQSALDEVEARTDLTPQQKGEQMRELARGHRPLKGGWRGARARHDQRVRRLTTLLPSVSFLDLHSAAHAEQVRRFARLYLSRREADQLAAMWVKGRPNDRRAIARGMLEQTYHASGLSLSEQGQAFWNKFRADAEELDRQSYGYGDTDVIETERGKVHVALSPSQLSSRVLLPSFRELQYAASKYNAASWLSRNVGARFYSDNADAAMGAIKMGWITTPAGGLRNALDELAGLGLRGDLPQVLKFRARYSAANKARKLEIRKAGKEHRRLVKELGKEGAELELAKRLKVAEETGDPEQIRAAMLEMRYQHAIAARFRGIADTVDDVLWAKLATRFLSATGRAPDADESRYLEDLLDAQRANETSHVISDTYYADDIAGTTDFDGPKDMMRSGTMPQRYGYRKTGYEEVEIDGGVSMDAWAANLHARFGDPNSPHHIALIGLWERMTSHGITEEQTEEVVAEVKDYLENDPAIRYFVENAELTDTKRDPNALEDAARRIVADTKLAVTGRGRPEFDPALVQEVRDHITRNSPRTSRPVILPDDMMERALSGEYDAALAPDDGLIDRLRRLREKYHEDGQYTLWDKEGRNKDLTDPDLADDGEIAGRLDQLREQVELTQSEDRVLEEEVDRQFPRDAEAGMGDDELARHLDQRARSPIFQQWMNTRNRLEDLQEDLSIAEDNVARPETRMMSLIDETEAEVVKRVITHEMNNGSEVWYKNDRVDETDPEDGPLWIRLRNPDRLNDERTFYDDFVSFPSNWRIEPNIDKVEDGWVREDVPQDMWRTLANHNAGGIGDSTAEALREAYERLERTRRSRNQEIESGRAPSNNEAWMQAARDVEGLERQAAYEFYTHELAEGRPIWYAIDQDGPNADSWVWEKIDSREKFDEMFDQGYEDRPDVQRYLTDEQRQLNDGGPSSPMAMDLNDPDVWRVGRRARPSVVHKGFQGHVTDEQIRKYLKREKGVQLQPGDYGNGTINGELAEMLINGLEVPSRDWLARLPEEYRPLHAMKERFAPVMPTGVTGRIANNWTEFLAKGYKKVVTDQVQALVRNPLMAAKYTEARKTVEPYAAQLKRSGWNDEAADAVAHRIALAHSEQEVLKHIDNPTVASQFSVLARNFWAFERAQEDWLRRWGRNLRDDPTIIRKGQLGVHGAESAGIVHQDEDGNLVFTYPGSGALIGAINKVINAMPGVESQVKIPVVPDLSSRLTFLNPSLDNPVGFSATPVISIPFKFIASTFGADYPILMNGMDRVVNGELGANREWYEQMMPTFVARIINGNLREDPDSQFAQAWTQAISQMEAAGALDDLTGADAAKLQDFYDTLHAQIKNNMFGRALFGAFAPASPGVPENTVDGENLAPIVRENYPNDESYETALAEREQLLQRGAGNADWSWHKQGLESLRAEWRVIQKDMTYEEAMEWWTRNHPGELIYTATHGGATSKLADGAEGATAPATLTAAEWMQNNADFLRSYPGIGTYFIPQGKPGTPGGTFSNVAYRAQIEQGIRVKKDLREFLNGVIIARGESIYYDTKDDYDDAIASAQRANNTVAIQSLEAQWAQEKALIEGTNPLFAAKNAEFAQNEVRRQQQMRDLALLMNDPRSFKAIGTQALGVERMADAWASYQKAQDQLVGQRGPTATRDRARLRANYDTTIRQLSEQYPDLADLARGVFRIPS